MAVKLADRDTGGIDCRGTRLNCIFCGPADHDSANPANVQSRLDARSPVQSEKRGDLGPRYEDTSTTRPPPLATARAAIDYVVCPRQPPRVAISVELAVRGADRRADAERQVGTRPALHLYGPRIAEQGPRYCRIKMAITYRRRSEPDGFSLWVRFVQTDRCAAQLLMPFAVRPSHTQISPASDRQHRSITTDDSPMNCQCYQNDSPSYRCHNIGYKESYSYHVQLTIRNPALATLRVFQVQSHYAFYVWHLIVAYTFDPSCYIWSYYRYSPTNWITHYINLLYKKHVSAAQQICNPEIV